MSTPTPTPQAHTVPLPPSPSFASSPAASAPPALSSSRPSLKRSHTSKTITRTSTLDESNIDPFYEGSTIHVSQPVGSLSISPSFRDVCLASRKGLYILDLADLERAPRFIAQGGTWQIADCQWSPHAFNSHFILSTSSQKLLVWDLLAQTALYRSIDAHARAITDINWHARNPHLAATCSIDAGIRGWDMRMGEREGPFMRLCAWGQGGTQVKWNRQHEHILATSHGKEVCIWDNRKGTVPLVTIKGHDAKIYGIDWSRRYRHNIVTCSLDRTVKFWTIPGLASSSDPSLNDYYPNVHAPEKPVATIHTRYPVWRARNLPFGFGVLTLPQRGETSLEMFNKMDRDQPVERFAGHEDVVKEFVWRQRGGADEGSDDREFQLITWSKDRTLRIWPVSREMTERVGFRPGAKIEVLMSRKGAKDVTYTHEPAKGTEQPGLHAYGGQYGVHQSLVHAQGHGRGPGHGQLHAHGPGAGVGPAANPSGISKQKLARAEVGMTRGGGTRQRGMDQLEWLTKVVKNRASPASSRVVSRLGSVSRAGSRSRSASASGLKESRLVVSSDGYISLKDEVVLVNRTFPRPRINFEKIDLHHRKLTMTMNGPWANGDRMAFIRIHWSFPASYPYSPDIPTFELEKNPTVSPITRQKLILTLKDLRAQSRQCLVSTSGFLLGLHERPGRGRVEDTSDSGSDAGGEDRNERKLDNVPMLIRTSGATFGPNGQLVCFFPKQTVLPRTRGFSRSPSLPKEGQLNPLSKAMAALSRLENPAHRGTKLRMKPRMRRVEAAVGATPTVAGSTLTIHDLAHLGSPDPVLAKLYGLSLESNLCHALDHHRLDHAAVWATLRGVLADPPPPYSRHPPLYSHPDTRKERDVWERGMTRRRILIDRLYADLMATKDVQMLALVSIVLLVYEQNASPPPAPEPIVLQSPEQDYFALPRNSTVTSLPHTGGTGATGGTGGTGGTATGPSGRPSPARTPARNRSMTGLGMTGVSPGLGPLSYRSSGWSQILNPSSVSIRQGITPGSRGSHDMRRSLTVDPASQAKEEDQPSPLPDVGYSSGQALGSAGAKPQLVPSGGGRNKQSPRRDRKFSTSPSMLTPLRSVGSQEARATSQHGSDAQLNEQGRSAQTPGLASGFPTSSSAGHAGRHGSSASAAGAAPDAGSTMLGAGSGGHKGSFGSYSPVRRVLSRRTISFNASPAISTGSTEHEHDGSNGKAGHLVYGAGGGGIKTCAVRIEIVPDESEPIGLLSPEMREMAEGFKLAYADWLLRVGLLAKRAELLQYQFVEDAGSGSRVKAAFGDIPAFAAEETPERAETGVGSSLSAGLRVSRLTGSACIACASGASACPSCSRRPIRPTCAYCRLPIRGLSMRCRLCSHSTHAACLRRHSSSPSNAREIGATSSTCPACDCSCLTNGGLTSGQLVFPLSPQPKTGSSSTRVAGRPALARSPEGTQVGPAPSGAQRNVSGGQRMTYASLASLGRIRDEDRLHQAGRRGSHSTHTGSGSGQQMPVRMDEHAHAPSITGVSPEESRGMIREHTATGRDHAAAGAHAGGEDVHGGITSGFRQFWGGIAANTLAAAQAKGEEGGEGEAAEGGAGLDGRAGGGVGGRKKQGGAVGLNARARLKHLANEARHRT